MAPGIFLPNYAHYKDFLRGNVIDDVRLFRFDVTQRSDLVLFLMAASDAPFDPKLLDDQGRYLQCNCGSSGEETIRRQILPGRYFVVVQAHDFGWGPFTLYRQSRLITHVNVTFDGTGYEQVTPGSVTRLAAHVTPAVDGPVTIEVEYFDPVARWQFYRNYHVNAINGLAQIPFRAPTSGAGEPRCRSTERNREPRHQRCRSDPGRRAIAAVARPHASHDAESFATTGGRRPAADWVAITHGCDPSRTHLRRHDGPRPRRRPPILAAHARKRGSLAFTA